MMKNENSIIPLIIKIIIQELKAEKNPLWDDSKSLIMLRGCFQKGVNLRLDWKKLKTTIAAKGKLSGSNHRASIDMIFIDWKSWKNWAHFI